MNKYFTPSCTFLIPVNAANEPLPEPVIEELENGEEDAHRAQLWAEYQHQIQLLNDEKNYPL